MSVGWIVLICVLVWLLIGVFSSWKYEMFGNPVNCFIVIMLGPIPYIVALILLPYNFKKLSKWRRK